MKKIENVFYKETGLEKNLCDLYIPDAEEFPVYVYFHGGGITSGSKGGNPHLELIAQKGIAVVDASYRLYPDVKYPEFLEDAASAVAWAKENMGKYGKVTGIFVGGSSAGGYITQMLCFDKKYLAEVGIDADEISGYVMDAGQPTAHFNVLREHGEDSRRVIIDERAPIYYIDDTRTYPPMQIFVAENDMENRYEQTILLMSTLKHFGHDMERVSYHYMEGYRHCRYTNEVIDGRCRFSDMVAEFIKKYEVK